MPRNASVPILLYHDVQPDGQVGPCDNPLLKPYILPVSEFQKQMGYLDSRSYKGVSLAQFLQLREFDPASLDHTVVMVFDDGWKGQYEFALPILKKAGFSATFFVIADFIGREGYMDWDSLEDLTRQGMEIGSHSLTHPCPTELSEEELYKELEVSKAILERGLNHRIDALSSPTGFFDDRMPGLAQQAGYRSLCISRVGLNGPSTDPFALKKIGIKCGQSFGTFKGIVHRNGLTLASLRSAQMVRNVPKKLLRRRKYEKLKAAMLSTT